MLKAPCLVLTYSRLPFIFLLYSFQKDKACTGDWSSCFVFYRYIGHSLVHQTIFVLITFTYTYQERTSSVKHTHTHTHLGCEAHFNYWEDAYKSLGREKMVFFCLIMAENILNIYARLMSTSRVLYPKLERGYIRTHFHIFVGANCKMGEM